MNAPSLSLCPEGWKGLTVDFLTTGQASRPILDILLSRVTVRKSVVTNLPLEIKLVSDEVTNHVYFCMNIRETV